jgi:hypothetical protein
MSCEKTSRLAKRLVIFTILEGGERGKGTKRERERARKEREKERESR